jgi:hypothetical protein
VYLLSQPDETLIYNHRNRGTNILDKLDSLYSMYMLPKTDLKLVERFNDPVSIPVVI